MIGYKVVLYNPVNSWRASFMGYGAVYHRWRETTPKNGPLCVFDTKNHAFQWLGTVLTSGNLLLGPHLAEIWECEYKPSAEKCIWCTPDSVVDITDLPYGTQLAASVTLQERIFVISESEHQ